MSGEFVLLGKFTPGKQTTHNLNQSVKDFKFIVVKGLNTATTIIPIQEIDEIRNDSSSSGYHTVCGTNGSDHCIAWFEFRTDTTVYFDNTNSTSTIRIYGVR